MLVMMKLGWRMNMTMVANTTDTPSDLRFCYPDLTEAVCSSRICLKGKNASPKASLARCMLVGIALFVTQTFCFEIDQSQAAHYKTQHYKQYAFIQLNDVDEFYCLDELWFKESRWNPKADNPKSTAYGIPQILKLKETNPFKQIDIGLRYIEHKHGTPCKALSFFNRKGYY